MDRDKKGRFAAGNGGGPGRPKKSRDERYYEITQQGCTFADWKAVVKKAVAQAKKGDSVARKWLADYLMGSPAQRLELSGADGGPIAHTFDLSELSDDDIDKLGNVLAKITT